MKIVLQKLIGKNELVIRYPQLSDAQAMCEYINQLSAEQTYIRFQGETMTQEEEKSFLVSLLQKIDNKQAVQLLTFLNGQLIGNSGITLKDKIEAHEGIFGISIASGFRGQGIGRMLMASILAEATKEMSDLKIISLGVFANNEVAIKMYEKFGFSQYGRLPKGIRYQGDFVDHVYMFKEV